MFYKLRRESCASMHSFHVAILILYYILSYSRNSILNVTRALKRFATTHECSFWACVCVCIAAHILFVYHSPLNVFFGQVFN